MKSAQAVRRAGTEVFCLALVLVAAWPLLLGRSYCLGDVLPQGLPFMAALQVALREGQVFVWNSAIYSGYPAICAGQSWSVYPLAWLAYGLLPLLSAHKLAQILHYWILARGLFGAARCLDSSRRAAAFAASVGLLGAVTAAHTLHFNVIAGMAWTGPLLWLSARLVRRPRAGASVWALGGCLGLALLGSQPQYVWYALVACACLAVAARTVSLPSAALRLITAGIVAAPLAAAYLLPVSDYVGLYPRPRPGGDLAFLAGGGMRAADLCGWLLGTPRPETLDLAFFGVTTWGLAGLGLTRWRASPMARVGVALACVGLILMWGHPESPLYRLLIYVPPFNIFRQPARFAWLLQLGVAFLAAAGVDALLRGRLRPRAGLASAAVVVALTSLAALVAPEEVRGGPLALGLLGLASLAAATRSCRPGASRGDRSMAAAATLACVLLELALVWHPLAKTVPDAVLEAPPRLAQHIARSTNPRTLDIALPEEQTLASARRLKRNSGARWGVSYFSGYEPLAPLAQEVAFNELRRALVDDPDGRFESLCDRYSVRWIVTAVDLPTSEALRRVDADSGATLYENLDAWPTAYTLPRREKAGEGAPPDERGRLALEVERLENTRWRLLSDAPTPTRAVLTQVWYPGWIATVDGEPAPVELSDALFVAVDLPPGRHELELAFDNATVFLALRLSITAWLVWLLAGLLLLRRI